MGLLSSVTDPVSNAAKAAGTPLDTASNMLAGNLGDGATNATETGTPKWWRGYDLDVNETTEESAGQAPNLPNAINSFPVVEFIHFGWVHTTHSNFFPHAELSGTKKDAAGNAKIKAADRPRAIQFRSALEREALLLWLFMLSTQQVLKQKEDDSQMGGLSGALDTASAMFGGNKASGGQTQSSELTSYMAKVKSAITPILTGSIVYKNVHKAGVDLHTARASYRKLLDKIVKEEPQAGKGGIAGTLMDQAASLPSTVTGGQGGSTAGDGPAAALGTAVSFTQGVVFKAQDVMAKLYAYMAQQQEGQIEDASNEMTYQAIHQTMNPFFPVWFTPAGAPPPPADDWRGPTADPLADKHGTVIDYVKSATTGVDQGMRDGMRDTGNSIRGIFERPPENPPPGTEALGMAFDDPPKHKADKTIVPMAMGAVAYQAFSTVLKLPSLGFAETAVSAVMGIVLEFTKKLYDALLVRDPANDITDGALVVSAANDLKLASRLEAIAIEKLTFLDTVRKWDVNQYTKGNSVLDGFGMKPGAGIMDRGSDFLDTLIASKVAPLLDIIVSKAMVGVSDKLDAVRKQGVGDNCHTMEWYLGVLPRVQATLFSDLFFPFWTALMKAGADVIGGPVGSSLKSILAVGDKMKKQVDTVRDDAAKAKAYAHAADEFADNPHELSTGGMDQGTRDALRDLRAAKNAQGGPNTASKKADTPEQQAVANHPLKSRVDTGTGQEIPKADFDQMFKAQPPIFKWHDPDTSDPGASRDGAADRNGGAKA